MTTKTYTPEDKKLLVEVLVNLERFKRFPKSVRSWKERGEQGEHHLKSEADAMIKEAEETTDIILESLNERYKGGE